MMGPSEIAPSRPDFDTAARRVSESATSLTERDLLEPSVWAFGEDGRLREDVRFRETPWGRWMGASDYLANDVLERELRRGERAELLWQERCAELGRHVGARAVVCEGDPRLVFFGDRVRLAARELSEEPLLEEASPLEQYRTHLPVLTLEAAAASEPAGDWGPKARAQSVEPRGWLRVDLDRPLNDRMFVARLRGSSMDDGHSGLRDRAWVVFEFSFHRGVAYDSGKAKLDVLVRGAFRDPETGSYAVKRWDRGAEVRLRSLNPDRVRYPDIVVPDGTLDELRVIATVREALSPTAFARKPRPRRKVGTRALGTKSDLQRLGDAVAARGRSFFEGSPPPDDGEDREVRWGAELVCRSYDEGGPHLEVGPLVGLPGFVKRLQLVGTQWSQTFLASNARTFAVRERVDVTTGPWTLVAPGFEEELERELGQLTVEPPHGDQLTPFRVGADGIGRRVATVTPGERYRLLVPPTIAVPEAQPLTNGWRLWEIEVDLEDASLVARLEELGLRVGEAQLALGWVPPLPERWSTSPRGEEYACFAVGADPVVAIRGGAIEEADDAVAVLVRVDTGESTHVPIEPGPRAFLKLEGLAVGRYVLAVTHRRVAVRPVRLFFEIDAVPTPVVDAAWRLLRDGEPVQNSTRLDLRELGSDSLRLEGPPGWPVAIVWEVQRREFLGSDTLDADGSLSGDELLRPLEERRRRERLGDVTFELGELGAITVRHKRHNSPAAVRDAIARLTTQRSQLLSGQGSYSDLLRFVVGPVCDQLGFDLGADDGEGLFDGPGAVTRWLERTEPVLLGLERKKVRLLVLGDALESLRTHSVRTWIDDRCRRAGVRDAILTTGELWTEHRVDSTLNRRVYALGDVTNDDEAWQAFLEDFAEGL